VYGCRKKRLNIGTFFDNHYKGRSSAASVRLYMSQQAMSTNRFAHSNGFRIL